MNKLYTAQEIADKLKIKKTTVYELIKRGELESSKIGKQLRISEEQLNRYLQGGDPPVPEAPLPFPDFQPESSLLKRDYLLYSNGLIISGQASPALEYLINQMAIHPNGLPVLHSHLNTYNGLYSLYFKKSMQPLPGFFLIIFLLWFPVCPSQHLFFMSIFWDFM